MKNGPDQTGPFSMDSSFPNLGHEDYEEHEERQTCLTSSRAFVLSVLS
jgi:hypothetical protein